MQTKSKCRQLFHHFAKHFTNLHQLISMDSFQLSYHLHNTTNTLYCISRHSAFRSVEGICCVYWQLGLPLFPTCHNSKQRRAEKDQGNQRNMTEKQQEPHGSSKQTGHNPNTSRARELTLALSFFTAHQWH